MASPVFDAAGVDLGLSGIKWNQLSEKSVVAPLRQRRIAPGPRLAAEAAGLPDVSDACRAMMEFCLAA
jgi:hypothetical protein